MNFDDTQTPCSTIKKKIKEAADGKGQTIVGEVRFF